METKRLKRDKIVFMNKRHDDVFAGLMGVGCIGIGLNLILIFWADHKRWEQTDSYGGIDDAGDNVLDEVSKRFQRKCQPMD